MIRKEWKPREQKSKDVDMKGYRDGDGMDEDDEDEDEEEEEEEAGEKVEEEVETAEDDEDESADLEATPRMLPRTTGIHSPQSSVSSSSRGTAHPRNNQQTRSPPNTNSNNANVAGLTNSLNSLSLVPNSVRFGRGGKGGFTQQPRGARGRGRGRGGGHGGAAQAHNTQRTEVNYPPPGSTSRGGRGGGIHTEAGHTDGGLGARGRGRGRIVPPRAGGRGGGRARGFER